MTPASKFIRPLATSIALLLACGSAYPEVITDGRVGPATAITKAGNDFAIPDTLGTKMGGNLFHSFSALNLTAGESATFSGPGDVANVLARVTGGNPSSIDGTLRSTIPGANLFLINPKGIVFGPNAALDVSGAFTASSADYLKLADGGRFDASNPAGDSLTSAPVSAFGFLDSPGPITIGGSTLTANGFSVIGGNIDIGVQNLTPARITSNGGPVVLASTASRGEFAPDGSVIASAKPNTLGNITTNGQDGGTLRTVINASGTAGGAVSVNAGTFTTKNTRITSSTSGGGTGGDVSIRAARKIEIGKDSDIETLVAGPGTGGNVSLSSPRINIGNAETGLRARVRSTVLDTPAVTTATRGGNVRIRAGRLVVANSGSQITTSTFGKGKSGRVNVAAKNIEITGDLTSGTTGIFSNSNRTSTGTAEAGAAGGVKVKAGSLRITLGGAIRSDTVGDSNGGNVDVTADDIFIANYGTGVNVELLKKTGIFADTGILENGVSVLAGKGNGGNVSVTARNLTIVEGGLISTKTVGGGLGGNTNIKADHLRIARGKSGQFTGLAADSAVVPSKRGGNITVDADRLEVLAGGQISANTRSLSPGGSVIVRANEVTVSGRSTDQIRASSNISADTQLPGTSGIGGNVSVTTDVLRIFDGARISANTFGSGSGGNVTVVAREGLFAQGGSDLFTGVSATSQSPDQPGPGGNVRVAIQNLRLDGGGVIANTVGPGRGGDVLVESDTLNILRGGRIAADTEGLGTGGNISVIADDLFISGAGSERDTGIVSRSVATGPGGNGGTIEVTSGNAELRDGALVGASSTSSGDGGSVVFRARRLAMESGASIEASASGKGVAGSVRVEVSEPLVMRSGSNVSTTSEISDSGTVEVASASDIILEDSSITVRATQGNAGRIALFAPGTISLNNSTILAEAGLNGGDVFIDPQYVLLEDSRISANAILGAGGNINIITNVFLATESAVTASSEASVQGTVRIETLQGDISGALVTLGGTLVSTKTNLAERCAMRLEGDVSTFLLVGRGGVAPAPDEALPLLPLPKP